MTRPRFVWGAAAAVVYVGVAAASFWLGLFPARPVYDGLAPPMPYRWVDPPPEMAPDNLPAEPGDGAVELTPDGSGATSVGTADGQVFVVFRLNAVAPREAETEASITITPLAPDGLGQAPEGLNLDGNAYEIQGVYAESGEPIEIAGTVTVGMRYPIHAETLVELDNRRWAPVDSMLSQPSMQVFADLDRLGTFAAAGPPGGDPPAIPWWAYAAAGGGLAVAAGSILIRRFRAVPDNRAERRRKAGRSSR